MTIKTRELERLTSQMNWDDGAPAIPHVEWESARAFLRTLQKPVSTHLSISPSFDGFINFQFADATGRCFLIEKKSNTFLTSKAGAGEPLPEPRPSTQDEALTDLREWFVALR